MLYSIHKIQAKLAINPEYQKQKTEIMQFFHMNNLINCLGVNVIYTSDIHPPFLIEKQHIEHICQFATQKFGVLFQYETFYEGKNALVSVSENEGNIKKYNVANSQELEHIIDLHFQTSNYGLKEQEKEAKRQDRIEKEAIVLAAQIEDKKKKEWAIFDKATNLKRDFTSSKVVSIDFEFFSKKKQNGESSHIVTEVGFSISENNTIHNHHYLVEENYQMKKNRLLQNSFHFGETKILKLDNIKKILNDVLGNADYILFHEQKEDMQILDSLHTRISPHTIIVDTQLCYKRYFRQKGSLPNGEPLINLLTTFNIPHQDLHNAGNDAHYTWQLFKKMQDTLILSHSKSSDNIKK